MAKAIWARRPPCIRNSALARAVARGVFPTNRNPNSDYEAIADEVGRPRTSGGRRLGSRLSCAGAIRSPGWRSSLRDGSAAGSRRKDSCSNSNIENSVRLTPVARFLSWLPTWVTACSVDDKSVRTLPLRNASSTLMVMNVKSNPSRFITMGSANAVWLSRQRRMIRG